MSFKFQQPVDWQQIWFDFKSQPDSQRRPERERGPKHVADEPRREIYADNVQY